MCIRDALSIGTDKSLVGSIQRFWMITLTGSWGMHSEFTYIRRFTGSRLTQEF